MPGNGARTRYLYMFDTIVVVRKFVLCSAPPIMHFCEVVHGNDFPTNGTRKDALRRMSARPNIWICIVFILVIFVFYSYVKTTRYTAAWSMRP
jgi:hypothetical protein